MSIPPSLFTSGPRLTSAPDGDPARQAIASLRGYIYQIYASALAWLELKDSEELFLEVAEDYAVAAQQALSAVQVKDTADSGSLTINSEAVRSVLDAFVDLTERNPGREITVRLLSTSPIGQERELQDRINGEGTLHYWRKAAAGADVGPLRRILEKAGITNRVRSYVDSLSDERFRTEFVRHIHWDCGQPRLDALRDQLDASLVRYGSTRLNLPAAEGKRLSAHVINALLATVTTAGTRQLTGVDLFKILSNASHVSVSRSDLDALLRSASVLLQSRSSEVNTVPHRRQLELERELPLPNLLTNRTDLVEEICETLRRHGAAAITGGTGMGKTLLARMCARTTGGNWFVLDLRDGSAAETVERLRLALGEIAELRPTGVILDDANEIEDAIAQKAIVRFLVALKRSDALCLFTLYRAISARACAEIGIEINAQTMVSEFTKDEVGGLVTAAGGDAQRWSPAVYAIGSFGHPQLVLATIVGFRARSWPTEELARARNLDFSTAEVEVERRAARGRLIAAIPDDTRSLLYRLSLVAGRFDRKIALAVSEVVPAVTRAGEQLDQLIGPWIDQSSSSELRISPLISNAGDEMLLTAEKNAVHHAIAQSIMGERSVDIGRADVAFLHGLLGQAEIPLTMIATSVITASPEMRAMLAEWLTGLRYHRTDRPIFPANPVLSRMLRLAQFLIRAETGDVDSIRESWIALNAEAQAEPNVGRREKFEAVILTKSLVGQSIAGVLEGWLQLLLRLDLLSEKLNLPRSTPMDDGDATPTLIGVLFINQALGMKSVSKLAQLFNDLDGLSEKIRERLFSDVESAPNSFGLIVDQAWLADHKRGAIDWPDAAASYAKMASQASRWGYRTLAIHCHIARGVMLDEYLADPTSALNALSEAESLLGPDQRLSRARAKILFRRKDHAAALPLLREIGAVIALSGSVEQAFMMREAGICAAELNQWDEALRWFKSAHTAASRLESSGMLPMAIGLRADIAVAAYWSGDIATALREFSQTLDELPGLEPDSSIKAAYCQRVVRHTGLWLFGKITGKDLRVDGQPTAMVPGACSNPEPPEAIKSLPLGPLSVMRYLLVESEVSAGVDAGIIASFDSKLPDGRIPSMEPGLIHSKIEAAIRSGNIDAFGNELGSWVAAQVYLAENGATLLSQDALTPSYGVIPAATEDQLQRPRAVFAAHESLLAFGIFAACSGKSEVLPLLISTIERLYGTSYPGFRLALAFEGAETKNTGTDFQLAQYVHVVAQKRPLRPDLLFSIGVRFLEAAARSNFKDVLSDVVSTWIIETWTRVIESQRFQLRSPQLAVDAIQKAMLVGAGLGKAANVLLAAENAVDNSIDETFRNFFRSLS